MIRKDYSFDADVEDFEDDLQGKMRLPTRYDIAKEYIRNKTNDRGRWRRKKDGFSLSSDFDWQITYRFPSTIRDNRAPLGFYGAKNMSFRRLYLILCELFNSGKFFIDDYFETVYPYTIKDDVDYTLEGLKEEILEMAELEFEDAVVTKAGTFDKRYKSNKGMLSRLSRFEVMAREWEANYASSLADRIKEDIIESMATGQLQLENNIFTDNTTKARRKKVGLPAEPAFYATGQLINSIELFVVIAGRRNWQTSKGLMV